MEKQRNSQYISGTKGLFFTLDGIFAAALLVTAVLIIPGFIASSTPIIRTTLLANDATNVLAELNVSEVNNAYIQTLISNGTISNPDQSVLEQLAEFWANGENGNAQILSSAVLDPILENYELLVDGENIVGISGGTQLVSSRRLVSGIAKGRATEGFFARAFAVETSGGITTEVFRFHPQGSGSQGGKGIKIEKQVEVRADDILNATLYISIHYGISNINSMVFKVNGNDLQLSSSDWQYLTPSNISDNTHVAFTSVDVTEHMSESNPSENYIEFELMSSTSGNAHLHPGTRLEVTYEAEESSTSQTVTERVHYDDILSRETGKKRSGVWAVMPINIPEGATIDDAKLYLKAFDIEPYNPSAVLSRGEGNCSGLNSSNAYNIRVYLDDTAVDLVNSSTWPPGNEIDKTYNLTSLVHENTNVVSFYLNMYQDCFWGDGDTHLYSDWISNPDGSSYVEYTYTLDPSTVPGYGLLELNVVEDFATQPSNDVTFLKNLGSVSNVSAMFIELATLDTWNVTSWANGNTVFQQPRPYATPGAIYVDNADLVDGLNNFRILDCVGCTILPHSALSYRTVVPNQVGYGDAFDNESAALADANQRLADLLASYGVTLDEVSEETLVVGKVPSLFGPAVVEVRAWQ